MYILIFMLMKMNKRNYPHNLSAIMWNYNVGQLSSQLKE